MNGFIVAGGFLLLISIAVSALTGLKRQRQAIGFWETPPADIKFLAELSGAFLLLAAIPLAIGGLPLVFDRLFEQLVTGILLVCLIGKVRVFTASMVTLIVISPFILLEQFIFKPGAFLVRRLIA